MQSPFDLTNPMPVLIKVTLDHVYHLPQTTWADDSELLKVHLLMQWVEPRVVHYCGPFSRASVFRFDI